MLLEYFSQFDPFMSEHIRKPGNKGSGSTNYLSETIYEEFIETIVKKNNVSNY